MENILKLLPSHIREELKKLAFESIEEIRLKINSPVFVYTRHGEHILFKNGKTITALKEDIDCILRCATGNSLYAYSEDIKNGFITVKGGNITSACCRTF